MIALLLSFCASVVEAQWNPLNPVKDMQKQADGIVLKMERGTLRITACSDSIVRVTYAPGDAIPETPQYAITKKDWAPTHWSLLPDADGKNYKVSTPLVSVTVAKKDGNDSVCGCERNETFSGLRSIADVGGSGRREDVSLGDVLKFVGFDRRVFRAGAAPGGRLELPRRRRSTFAGEHGDCRSDRAVDEWIRDFLEQSVAQPREQPISAFALYQRGGCGPVDYYFIYGPESDQIVGHYRELTGEVPLFGRWAYGFWQCKNKYQSQAEIEGVAAKYRALHIPVDNIVQDWFWWVTMGEMKWNTNTPIRRA